MSSTNRGYDRHKSDYYITPKEPVKHFLDEFWKNEKIAFENRNNLKILDPACWWDNKHDMTYDDALMWNWFRLPYKIDIREDSWADLIWDYLNTNLDKDYDIIITNPPFHLAQEFIQKALSEVKIWWYVIMLLRLNFIGGKKRQTFWDKNKLYAIYAHNKRMKFTDWGWTDSIEYGHFVRKKWENPEFAKFKILYE